MYFKSLALLFASAVLAQSDSGFTQVSFQVGRNNPILGVADNDCSFFPYKSTPVSDITITRLEGNPPTCTFYTERGCEGQEYSLNEGEHHFSRDFFVGSFICSE